MSLYVIDAGIAVKWFIPEPDSDKARQLLEHYNQGADDLVAPDLIIPYDCLYLALSLDLGCDLITSDERLYNAVGATFLQLKLLRKLSF